MPVQDSQVLGKCPHPHIPRPSPLGTRSLAGGCCSPHGMGISHAGLFSPAKIGAQVQRAGQGRVVLLVRVFLREAWSLSWSPPPLPSPSPLVCLWRALTNPRRESLCYHQVNRIWRWACASRGLQTSTAAAVIADMRAGCYKHLHTPVTLPAPRGLSTQPTARIAASTRARPSSCLHFHCLA